MEDLSFITDKIIVTLMLLRFKKFKSGVVALRDLLTDSPLITICLHFSECFDAMRAV